MAARFIDEHPLLVIVGPTASGKTGLAIDIAKRFSGEIICADSRTVYKHMDIATAKPTPSEQQGIPHWGLDLVMPNEPFSVADFKKYADEKIIEIQKRGHMPILVGGTGLYVNAVLYNYQFGGSVNKKLRSELQQLSLDKLYDYCRVNQINLPENYKNKRYVIRAIENNNSEIVRNSEPVYKNIIVGITTDKNTLLQRIVGRIEQMLENGVVDEAKKLGNKYGWQAESMKSNMYQNIRKYLNGEATVEELKEQSRVSDWRLAKRQMTWFKRDKNIHWDGLDALNTYLSDQLVSTR